MFYKNRMAAAIFAIMSAAAYGEADAETEAQKNDAQSALEEVEVTGIRSSLKAASDVKRDSAVVQDSIVAEDLGKFPDQNVAESLQRIAGVSIDRHNGEGSQITVRGFGPRFNRVTLNGRTLATSEVGRNFDFQVLASELIAGADVIKSPMAKTPEGSIGAHVSINTARPLDKPGLQMASSLNAKYGELSGEWNPEVSGIISNTFADDKIGVSLAYSNQESDNRYDSAGTTRWLILDPSSVTGDIKDTDGNVVTPDLLRHPGRIEFALGQEQRERQGFNATVQFAPSENVVTTFDYMHTDFSAMTQAQGMQAGLQFPNWSDVVVSENGTVLSGTKFSGWVPVPGGWNWTPYRLDGLFQALGKEAQTDAFGFNTVMDIDDLSLSLDIGHSKATASRRSDLLVPNYVGPQDENGRTNDSMRFDFRGVDVVDMDTTIDYGDPSVVRAHWNQVAHNELVDDITEAKLDGSYGLELEFNAFVTLESVDMGVAYSDRTKSNNRYETPHVDNCGLINPGMNICGQMKDMPDEVFTKAPVSDFMRDASGEFPSTFVFADIDAYHAAIREMTGLDYWPLEQHVVTASGSATEEAESAYAQFNLRGEVAGMAWRGNIGARYVDTTTTSTGYGKRRLNINGFLIDGQAILDVGYSEPGQITAKQQYDDLLPSMNFSIDITDEWLARFAASKVMSRPAIDDIGPQTTYWDVHAGSFSQSGGNPYLLPYEADQLDFALEYYTDGGDAYAINLFRKDIKQFISSTTVLDNTPDIWTGSEWIDTDINIPGYGQVYETVNKKQNRAGGLVQGVELAARHDFDYLPGFFAGFGVQANYTWAQTKDEGAEPIDLPGVKDPGDKLEGFAEDSFNLVAYYDRNGIWARLAYNWRDDFLRARAGQRSGGLPEYTGAYGQLDFSASYAMNKHFSLTAEAINLTNEEVFQYADVEERLISRQYSGPRYRVGVRAKF